MLPPPPPPPPQQQQLLPSPPPTPRSFLPQLPAPPLLEPEPLVASESDDELKSVKRQKLDEEDAESSDSDNSQDYCTESELELDLERPFRPANPDEKFQGYEIWERYFKQINESEGFDIKDFPHVAIMTSVVPMPYYVTDPDPEDEEKMKRFTVQALEQYNQKNGTTYEVNEILKVNGSATEHLTFYITLSVKNGESEYFQVKVVEYRDHSLDFSIVRPRVKGGLDI